MLGPLSRSHQTPQAQTLEGTKVSRDTEKLSGHRNLKKV